MAGCKITKYLIKMISGDPVPLIRVHIAKMLEVPFVKHQSVQLKGRIATFRKRGSFTVDLILVRESIRAFQEG